jgi:hypothetical protein
MRAVCGAVLCVAFFLGIEQGLSQAGEEVGPPAPLTAVPAPARQASTLQGTPARPYLEDRGTGVPTSMFGTYVRHGELILYPFYEYYKDDDFEYKPSELGYPDPPGEPDYRGRYRAHEGLFFLAYGISENVAIEMEAAVIDASFEKSPRARSAGAGGRRPSGGPSSSATSRRWSPIPARRC